MICEYTKICDLKSQTRRNEKTNNRKKRESKRGMNFWQAIFLGFVQGVTRKELYDNAYVYVLPSDVEGWQGPLFHVK